MLLSREHDTVVVQASADESLERPTKASASQSADMEHGRPEEVREVLSSRNIADAFTQAFADITLNLGLTFQLREDTAAYDAAVYSDSFKQASADMMLDPGLTFQPRDDTYDPAAYDPAVYSDSSLNINSLQVTPGAVGDEEDPVTSSGIVAKHAPRHLPDTDRIGALESLPPNAWVSATALELILDCIKPEYCRVLSSGFVPQEANKLSDKKLLRLKDETNLWLPVHHRDHWTEGGYYSFYSNPFRAGVQRPTNPQLNWQH